MSSILGKRKKVRRTKLRNLKKRRPAATSAAVQSGFTRSVGFYGRFQQTGGGRNREIKFLDMGQAAVALSDSGLIMPSVAGGTIVSVGSYVGIPQGTTASQRVGRMVVLKKFMIRGYFDLPASTTAAQAGGDMVRFILYWDKQANGAAAAATDILATADATVYNNLINSGRFMILKDKWFNLPVRTALRAGGTTDTWYGSQKPFFIAKRCSIPIEFSSTTGAITELKSNNIGILAICERASNFPTVTYTARIRYDDS